MSLSVILETMTIGLARLTAFIGLVLAIPGLLLVYAAMNIAGWACNDKEE